jgi:succinate dehydrogenase/fumarate reductase subunit D
MNMEEEIIRFMKNLLVEVGNWTYVSERPGKKPFAKEVEYNVNNIFWGKIHIRNTGEIYLLVINKDVFNWKEKINELKIKGKVVDAAGGILWIEEESIENLKADFTYIQEYLKNLRSSQQR